MKKTFNIFLRAASVFAITGWLAGCTAARPQNKTVTASYQSGVPGGSYVETYQTAATLTDINPATRQMSFKAPDGSTNSFRAGPKFQSFNSYQVGDTVNVTVARELVTWFAPEAPPAATDVAELVRNQPGVKPGVLTAPTIELAATLLASEPQKHEATLRLSDGRVVTFQVRKDIDLTTVKIGTTGIIRTSAAMAVMMDKP
jgi:hypothetical protein